MFQLLIVDDERPIVDDLAETLPWGQHGIDVVHRAYSAFEALEIVGIYPVDVVITDIRMPGMTGLELAGKLREMNRRCKVIILSGYSEFDYAVQAMRAQSVDYLIKPVRDDVLIESVKKALTELRSEWEEISSFQRASYTLRTHLPTLRHLLLNDLLSGKQLLQEELLRQLELLELPLRGGDGTIVLLVRFNEEEPDSRSQSLMEYAVGNIAEEIYAGEFRLWSCKDAHGYLIFLGSPCEASDAVSTLAFDRYGRLALELQKNCSLFLKRSISVILSQPGGFPGQLVSMYRSCVQTARREAGNPGPFFLTANMEHGPGKTRTTRELYASPSLARLLEGGRWAEVERKATLIFQELLEDQANEAEYAAEVFWTLSSAIAGVVHGSGKRVNELLGEDGELMLRGDPSLSTEQMKKWFFRSIDKLKLYTEQELMNSNTRVIKQALDYMDKNIGSDLSLQAVADYVHHHPSYFSKLFKDETGQSFTDYITEIRMTQAVELLRDSSLRIYDISERLGFQYPHYFIRKFKKIYGVTPQEFRDRTL